MSDAIASLALDSLRRPVRYDRLGHCVVDCENGKVLDVRGWGRLSYLDQPEARQDAIGELLARLINEAVAEPTITLPRLGLVEAFDEALEDSSLDPEGFDFGPSYSMARTRRREAFDAIAAAKRGRA